MKRAQPQAVRVAAVHGIASICTQLVRAREEPGRAVVEALTFLRELAAGRPTGPDALDEHLKKQGYGASELLALAPEDAVFLCKCVLCGGLHKGSAPEMATYLTHSSLQVARGMMERCPGALVWGWDGMPGMDWKAELDRSFKEQRPAGE